METTKQWFENEEDWILKRPIIFNRNLVNLTFLEISRLIKLLDLKTDKVDILDLCCGLGRHSLEFARNGFNVTAVDITKPYLKVAEESALRDNLDIRFVHSDMKDFCEPETFDVVANLCTSFGYFDDIEDDLQVLRNIYTSLKPNGKFVIEVLGKEVIASTFKEVEELEYDGYHVTATSRILDDWSSLECKRLIRKDDMQQEITAYHRLYSATELKGHLKDIGFENSVVYGNFAGGPYDSKARSMIIISEKK